jgi:biotin-[acetyl-CoA-carboxylase] ligase BirA-like protein
MNRLLDDLRISTWRVQWYDCVGSTNDVVRSAAPDEPRLVVVADEQTAGRGQHGRRWESPAGANLLCSLRMPTGALGAAELVSLGAGIAVCRVLQEHDLAAQCKWPNDVLVGGAKIAGMLVEQVQATTIVGIGLNLNWPAPRQAGADNAVWTSLRAETGIAGERRRMLAQVLLAWNACMTADAALLLAGYRRCWHKPARVRVRCGDDWQPASVCDVNDTGALAVQLANGRLHTVSSSAQLLDA